MSETPDLLTALTANETVLRQFLVSRVGCPHVAADIYQRIAEKLLTRTDYAGISDQRAYLYQAARNEVVNYYRTEQTRRQYESESALVTGDMDHRSAERVELARENLQILNQALDELPQLTRQIFILYRVHGLKQKDIATHLRLNLSTIEKRLAKAIKHCRKTPW